MPTAKKHVLLVRHTMMKRSLLDRFRSSRLRNSAVRIVAHSSEGGAIIGTGVVLWRRPLLVLTAAHVLEVLEKDTTPAITIDGVPHLLRRDIRLPGGQEDLISVLSTRGRIQRWICSARLPRRPLPLSDGQTIALEVEAGGYCKRIEGQVLEVVREGGDETIYLDVPISEGDSGAPVFANSVLAGVCQARGAASKGGLAIANPLAADSLAEIRQLVGEARRPRVVLAAILACCVLASLGAFIWRGGFSPQVGIDCRIHPQVSVSLDGAKVHYMPGEALSLHYTLSKACLVTMEEITSEGDVLMTFVDRILRERGRHDFVTVTTSGPLHRIIRFIVSDSCGHRASDEVSIQVSPVAVESIPEHQVSPNGAVEIRDPVLALAIREALGIPDEPLEIADVSRLIALRAREKGVTDLEGLEACANLRSLDLGGNGIADISPIAQLEDLTELLLDRNKLIVDIEPLRELRNLAHLDLTDNAIEHLDALAGLASLQFLFLGGNRIRSGNLTPLSGLTGLRLLHAWNCNLSDISALSSLSALHEIHLENNGIADINALKNLGLIRSVRLDGNQIQDPAPLLENSKLSAGTQINLSGNYIDISEGSKVPSTVSELRTQGIEVVIEPQGSL